MMNRSAQKINGWTFSYCCGRFTGAWRDGEGRKSLATLPMDRKTSARKEKRRVLMARVDGLGRLIPTLALSKIMLHRAAGGLEVPCLKTVHCVFNEPSTVTVAVTSLPPR